MSGQRVLSIGAAMGAVLLYAFLLYWFDSRDFYQKHFFDYGLPVRHYERARLLFIFYFAWLVYAVGAMILSIVVGSEGVSKVQMGERFPLCFLIGVAVWSVILYALGLASLYQKPLAVGITVAVMLASIPHLAACIEEANSALARIFRPVLSFIRSKIDGDRVRAPIDDPISPLFRCMRLLPKTLVLIVMVVAAGMFLLVKGLYPGGGHDYYNHYFPYYLRVLQTGSILPNDVWYHFYLSKGDGLYFLAMLLSDPLAPQLVAAGFIICAACIVYALLRQIAPIAALPWVGVMLYFAFFIYTPGPHEFMVQGGWGDLQKEHELTAVLLFGVIWCVFRLFGTADTNKWPWLLGLHAAIVSTIIVTLQLGFLIGLYLTGYMALFAVKRQWQQAARAFFGCVSAAVTILIIFAINYDLTGLVLDQAILFTWPIVNLPKLAHWGALFEAITLDRAMVGLSANAEPWSRTIFWLLPCYLRLEIWWPLVVTGALFTIQRLFWSQTSRIRYQH